MSSRRLRLVQRTIHLVAATVLAVFLWSPLFDDATWQAAVRFVALPVLTITGFGIWLAPKALAAMRRRRVEQ